MSWTLMPGDEGYLLCKLTGHMSEPYGAFANQAKAMYVLEVMEWAETLMNTGVQPAPPKQKKRRARAEQGK
jgi:hypothetical protein